MKESDSIASSSASKPWSETRKGRIVVLAGVVGLFVLVFSMAMKSRRMVAEPAALMVDEHYLWLGEIWEHPAFVWILPIRNTTDKEIEIAGFLTTCPCAKIEPSSITIPPQGTVEVRLTLNLLSPHSEPNLAGSEFKVVIQPSITKGVGSRFAWVIQGKVKQPFAIDPPVVDFGGSLVRGQPFTSQTAVIACGLDVATMTVRCESPFLTAKVTRESKNPRRFRLEIHPQKEMLGGPFKHLLRITALTPSKKEVIGAVPAIGRVLEDVSLQPELVTFGAEPIGTRLQETVTLQSRSGKDFSIQEIEKGGTDDITVKLDRKRNDCRQCFVVSFPVKRLRHQEYTIHVKVKSAEELLDLPLRMSCYGIPAQTVSVTKQPGDPVESAESH